MGVAVVIPTHIFPGEVQKIELLSLQEELVASETENV